MILLIDHFDSFVHNQARYLERMGVDTCVVRCDAINVATVRQMNPQLIMLSPGPGTPSETHGTRQIIETYLGQIPLLGICLGHQTLAAVTGGTIIRAPHPCHGRASRIRHDQQVDFVGIPPDFLAARYHSLLVERTSLPSCWVPSAFTSDGLLMGMRHVSQLAFGWQFHPESVLTEHGFHLFANLFRHLQIPFRAVPDPESEVPSDLGSWAKQIDDPWRVPRSRDGQSLSF